MSSPHFLACLAACTLAALQPACLAQTRAAYNTPVNVVAVQPAEPRMGTFQPVESDADKARDSSQRPPQTPNLSVPMVSLGKDYRVGPNDLIDVEVLDLDNLKRTVRVNAAGAISLPLIGQVVVAGLTSQELEERIADRYREKYLQNPQVSIFIKEFTTERITIEGAVGHPGIFPLTGQITLLRAIAMAGGFGSIADSKQVMLYRVNEQRQREMAVFDVEKIRAGENDDPVIKGDDLIVVQRDRVRVLLRDSLLRDVVDSINPFSVLAPR